MTDLADVRDLFIIGFFACAFIACKAAELVFFLRCVRPSCPTCARALARSGR